MKVIYKGKDIYPDISVAECYLDSYAEKHCDEILLRLNDTEKLWDIWSPQKGDEIEIENGNVKSGKMFIESIVPESGLITLRAYSIPQSIKDKTDKSWEKVQFTQLASEIADKHGLALELYDVEDQRYDYVEQPKIPDLLFLQGRCELEGCAFLVYDKKLVIYSEAAMEGKAATDTLEITSADRFEYRNQDADAYSEAEIVNGSIKGNFKAPKGGNKLLRKILKVKISGKPEADRFAKNLLRAANKNATVATFWSGGLLQNYAAGSIVNISTDSAQSWNGSAFIVHIRHDLVKGKSKVNFRKPLEGY